MARYLFQDLKKVQKNESLNLKNSEGSLSKNPSPKPNLLNLERLNKGLHTGQNQNKNIESIQGLKPRETYHYIPVTGKGRRRIDQFFSGFRFAILGLLVVTLLNFFNILQNGIALKSTLIGNASAGFASLTEGADQAKNRNFGQANTSFTNAKGNFDQAMAKISLLNTENSLGKSSSIESVNHLLAAGNAVSKAGNLFTKSAENLINWPTLFIQANKDFFLKKSAGHLDNQMTGKSLTEGLKKDLENVQAAIQELQTARQELAQVNPFDLPQKYREDLPAISDQLNKLTSFLGSLSEHFPAVLTLLGDRYPNRYLILFQNDTEARPTGGFIGSLMILDLNDGYITKADFHDVYEYDGQLNEDIPAPEDIAMITEEWRLRDSNYSPEFAISAEKAAWFLQKSKGPSVDTVIAIDQSMVANLLAELGPIKVDPLKSEITAENFQFIISYLVESKYFGADNPKKILQKVIVAFQAKLLKLTDFQGFLRIMLKEIQNQKIMFYSRDAQVQNFFEYLNLTPHQNQLAEKEDYLQVVATSVGGNKSDLYITENLDHQTYIDSDGSITDELTITRKHNWTGAELLRWEKLLKDFGFDGMNEGLKDLEGRGINKASIKVYLPLGTELENTVGIEPSFVLTRSDPELKKTYFLLPMSVGPGEESSVTLRYKLPFKLKLLAADIYRFSAQAQPGLVPIQLRQKMNLSPSLTLLKTSSTSNLLPATTMLQDNIFQGPLKNDLNYSAVIAN